MTMLTATDAAQGASPDQHAAPNGLGGRQSV